MNEIERPEGDPLTMNNAECAAFMGISEARFYQLRSAAVIPDALLSPIPGRWSREKVARWLSEGTPAKRARRGRGVAA